MKPEDQVVCRECGSPSYWREWRDGKCPNPACFSGMAAWHASLREWGIVREEAWANALESHRKTGTWFNPSAWREIYERNNPPPQAIIGGTYTLPMMIDEWISTRGG